MAAMFSIIIDGKRTQMSLDEAGRLHVFAYQRIFKARQNFDAEFAAWGWLLIQIKEQMPPRESWIDFLHRADVHAKTAQRAMSIARECCDDGVFNPERVAAVATSRRHGRVLKAASHAVESAPKTTRVSFCDPQNGRKSGGAQQYQMSEMEEELLMNHGGAGRGERVPAAGAGAEVAPPAERMPISIAHGRAGDREVPGSGERVANGDRPGRVGGSLPRRAGGDLPGQLSWDEQFAAAAELARSIALMFDRHDVEPALMAEFRALAERITKGGA